MPSFHRHDFLRNYHKDVSADLTFATSYTGSDPLIACPSAKHQIFVQKIHVSVTTSASQTLTFQDNASTPIVLCVVPSAPGVGVRTFDFEDEGIPLTLGKDLDVAVSGAGLGGILRVDAYAKIPPTVGIVPSDL